ncbi:unnamed protein product [Lymnaea stagnalis]|uniref:Uncharacterized protein n=1 Tax=Lymnaea stagnalis TaxID=6523 RepID=A0AAV2H6B4_LYMST
MIKQVDVSSLLWLVTLAVMMSCLTAQCPVPAPCICDISVHCEGRNLSSIPKSMSNAGQQFLGFYLSRNHISTVTKDAFKGFVVSSIDLSHNPITSFDTTAFLGLEDSILELNLEDTHLTSFPASIAGLKNLQTLNIQSNPIPGIQSASTAIIGQSLLSFSLGRTGIRYWPSALNNLVRLQTLDLSNNIVSFLRDGAVQAFANTLTELRLINSSLTTFQTEFSKLTNLWLLDLSANRISSLPDGALKNMSGTLRKFSMSSAQLQYIPDALEDLTVLEELDLSNNPMESNYNDILNTGTSYTFSKSSATLRIINLSYCRLMALPRAITNLTSLEELDLSGNKIVSLYDNLFVSLTQLKKLMLNDNPLSRIPYKSFSGLISLTNLNLARCYLSYIPSSSIPEIHELNTLDLSNNQITSILDFAFPGANKLTAVDLSDNSIQIVQADAFNSAHSMKILKMSRCSLTNLPKPLSKADGLRTVYVDQNPIPCTCDLSWIMGWQAQSGLIPNIVGRCDNDPNMSLGTFVNSKLRDCDSPVTLFNTSSGPAVPFG